MSELCKYCQAVLCNGCEHSLVDLGEELQELRDWKAKALPYIEAGYEDCRESYEKCKRLNVPEKVLENMNESYAILTELIKEQ